MVDPSCKCTLDDLVLDLVTRLVVLSVVDELVLGDLLVCVPLAELDFFFVPLFFPRFAFFLLLFGLGVLRMSPDLCLS